MRLANPHEEGAVAVLSLFAITTFLLAVSLLAIDAGSVWVSRRTQVADTDAAALAAAQRLTESPCAPALADLASVAGDLILDGQVDPPVVSIQEPLGVCMGAGVVTVETTRAVDLFFAPLFGHDGRDTTAMSSVAYGQVLAAHGVKPFAFCAGDFDATNQTTAYAAVTSNPVYRIHMDTPSSPCSGGSGKGNIGIIDFEREGGVPGVKTINEWIVEGSKHEVDLGGSAQGDEDCNAGNDEDAEWCQGRPRNALDGLDVEFLLCKPSNCPRFYVVIYDGAGADPDDPKGQDQGKGQGKDKDEPDHGANVHYDVLSLAQVVLRAYNAPGPDDYVDLELVDEFAQGGRVGAADGTGFAPMAIQQCGVDGFDNCSSVLSP